MIRTIRTAVLILLTALLAASALAQDSGDSTSNREQFEEDIESFISVIPTRDEDYAMVWLERLFGDIAFIAWDETEGTTLLSEAIGFTNVIAMIFGCVIVAWVYLSAVLRTAHEGEVMGKQWSSLWLPMRTAIAFGLITPVGALSAIQVVVLTLVVVGSSAGTYLWNFVGYRILTGSSLVATEPVVGPTPVKHLFGSLVCAQNVYLFQRNGGEGGKVLVAQIRRDGAEPLPIFGPAKDADFTIPANATSIEFGNGEYSCGSVTFGGNSSSDPLFDPGEDNVDYHQRAVKLAHIAARKEVGKLLNGLGDVAQKLVNGVNEGGIGGAKQIRAEMDRGAKPFEEKHAELVSSYEKVLEGFVHDFPEAIARASAADKTVVLAFNEHVTKGGWGNAGAWFFDITRFQAISESAADLVLGSIAAPTAPSFCSWFESIADWEVKGCDHYEEIIGADMTYGVDTIHGAALESLMSDNKSARAVAIAALAKLGVSVTQDDSASKEKGLDTLSSALWAQVMLQATTSMGDLSTNGMQGDASVSATDSMANPFRTVAAIGESMNNVAVAAWTLGLGMSTTKEGMGILSKVPLLGGAKGALAWMGMTVVAVLAILVPMGFVLAFLVPFLPIIAWVRLVAAYLLTVIEAVVAAPLAVIMMATPEGEGIVGTRLERAIQLMAAVILKPTLIVIGLLAALSLAYVTFSVLNMLFWKTAASVTSWPGPFEIFGILVVYVGAAFATARGAVMVMHKLPDQILDWMAGGVGGRSFGDDAEQSIQGSMEQAKGSMGNVAGSLSKRLGDRQQQIGSPGNQGREKGDDSRG